MSRPEVSGLGTFRITLVRPLHFYDVPNASVTFRSQCLGTNLRRRSDSMLQQPCGIYAEIHSPPASPCLRDAVFWVIVTPIRFVHPLYTDETIGTVSTETRKLLAALGYQPRTFTSFSLPSGLTEFTARCLVCETKLRSTEDFLFGISGDPLRDHLNQQRQQSFRSLTRRT